MVAVKARPRGADQHRWSGGHEQDCYTCKITRTGLSWRRRHGLSTSCQIIRDIPRAERRMA